MDEKSFDAIVKMWRNIEYSIPDWNGECPNCYRKNTVKKAVWNPLNSAPMREYGCMVCNYKWGKEYLKST